MGMMARGVFALVLLLAGCGSRLPAHVETLRNLERNTPIASIEYRHRPTEVAFPDDHGKNGVVRADCSGLLNEVFKHTEGIDDAELTRWLGSARPVARDYAAAIRDENGFERIHSLFDARVGDVIAIRYEQGASNTGHIMVIDAKPIRTSTIATPGATLEWRCHVIDSSATGHGEGDSRFRDGKRVRQGLGRGIFRIFTDAQGTPVAHAFIVANHATIRSVELRPIFIGRLARNVMAQ